MRLFVDLDNLLKKIGADGKSAGPHEIVGEKLLSLLPDFVAAGAGIPMVEVVAENELFLLMEFAGSRRSVALVVTTKDPKSVLKTFRERLFHVG